MNFQTLNKTEVKYQLAQQRSDKEFRELSIEIMTERPDLIRYVYDAMEERQASEVLRTKDDFTFMLRSKTKPRNLYGAE